MKEELTQRTWPRGTRLGFDRSAQHLHEFDSLTSLLAQIPYSSLMGKSPEEAGGNWKICDLEMAGARGRGGGGGAVYVERKDLD